MTEILIDNVLFYLEQLYIVLVTKCYLSTVRLCKLIQTIHTFRLLLAVVEICALWFIFSNMY